jgi:hypothetical protein
MPKIEDRAIINFLLNDPVFIRSVEDSEGKLQQMWPDWDANVLVYEFKDGSIKESKLTITEILEKIDELGYMKSHHQ